MTKRELIELLQAHKANDNTPVYFSTNIAIYEVTKVFPGMTVMDEPGILIK